MKLSTKKSLRNGILLSLLFILGWVLFIEIIPPKKEDISVLKIFIVFWGLMFLWIGYSGSKKYYNKKREYFPKSNNFDEQDFLSKSKEWKKLKQLKIYQFCLWFSITSLLLALYNLIKYVNKSDSIRDVIFYASAASISLLVGRFIKKAYGIKNPDKSLIGKIKRNYKS